MFSQDNDDDLLDEFVRYDITMDTDVVKCPHCGAEVPCSLFFEDEVQCPVCKNRIRKSETS